MCWTVDYSSHRTFLSEFCAHILQSEVEKAIKEMRNRKATGDEDIPGDVLKLLGKGGLKILTKLSNTIYKTLESDPRTLQKLQ